MNLQAMMDGLNAQWQKERSNTQMTLGQLIDFLEGLDPEAQVVNLVHPHSYRGYYSDLAFEHAEGTRAAGDLLSACRLCMGEVFEGYKGGDFVMGKLTPLWVASYGCCGLKLMRLGINGDMETAEDEY